MAGRISEKDRDAMRARLRQIKGEMDNVAFAAKCGIPYSTMVEYLNGKMMPGREAISKIARACNVAQSWLAEGRDIRPLEEVRIRFQVHAEDVLRTIRRRLEDTLKQLETLRNRIESDMMAIDDALALLSKVEGISDEDMARLANYVERSQAEADASRKSRQGATDQ